MKVEITQFHTPNGRQTTEYTELPDDCAVGYESLKRHGCRLTAEVLLTGHVSICIEHPDTGDFDIEVVGNGPIVLETMADMIRKFDGAKFEQWLQEAE